MLPVLDSIEDALSVFAFQPLESSSLKDVSAALHFQFTAFAWPRSASAATRSRASVVRFVIAFLVLHIAFLPGIPVTVGRSRRDAAVSIHSLLVHQLRVPLRCEGWCSTSVEPAVDNCPVRPADLCSSIHAVLHQSNVWIDPKLP